MQPFASSKKLNTRHNRPTFRIQMSTMNQINELVACPFQSLLITLTNMILELTILLITLLFAFHYSRKWRLPPGPFSLPIIGTYDFYKTGMTVGNMVSPKYYKYGDMYTIYMGPMSLVMINDFQLNKELLAKDEFSGRMDFFNYKYIRGSNGHAKGILTTESHTWSTQRRFALKQLRDLGFGRKSLDAVMVEEVDQVIEKMLLTKNPVEINGNFNTAIFNVLWQMVGSKRFDPEAPDTQEMMDLLNKTFKISFQIQHFFPHFIAKLLPYTPQDEAAFLMKDKVRQLIDEHLVDIDYEQPRDFIDVYLRQINEDPKNFEMEHLITTCLDFFQAGAETTSTTLLWAIKYMILNPEVQKKCQLEIDEILGEKLPSIEDYGKLTYNVATCMEIQRLSRVGQRSLIHRLLKDTEVHGYKFPKGQHFATNIEKCLLDPIQFPQPEKFNPDRFLNQNGQIVKNDHLIPFGIGKRICMGESLAKNELFVFFVRLVQRLDFKPTEKVPHPDDCICRMTRIPNPFFVNISERITLSN